MTTQGSHSADPETEINQLRQRIADLERLQADTAAQCQALQHLLDTVPTLLSIFDMQTCCFTYLNAHLRDVLGYLPNTLTGWDTTALQDLIHSDDQARIQEYARQMAAAQDGDIIDIECRLRHADGSWRSLHCRTTVLQRSTDGQPQHILGSAQDVSSTRQHWDKLIAYNQHVTTIFESITDAFFALDSDWCFTYLNSEAERLLRKPRAKLLGQNIWQAYPEAVSTTFYHKYQRAYAEQATTTFEAFYAPFQTWFEVRVYPSSAGLSVYFHDVTAQRQSREQLAFQANVLSQVNDAVVAVDILRRITYWNKGAEQLYGFRKAEVLGQRFDEVCHRRWLLPEDEQETTNSLAKTGQWRGRHIYRTKRSKDITVESHMSILTDDQHTTVGLLTVARDITAHKRALDLLQWRALHDTLTHLPNRLLFLDRLGTVLERVNQPGSPPCAVLFLDLDNFKIVNDSLGHMVGDRMLIAVARKLEESLPNEAMVARFGGDEFIILLDPVQGPEEALRIATRIHDALNTSIVLSQSRRVVTSASIGIALSDPRYDDPEDLLRDANVAMNISKKQRSGSTLVFDTAMYAQAQERLWLETELRQAIDQEELVPFYQPIISLITGEIVGFEVLTRWQHPQRGIISPETFIPIAEENGLIGLIGQKILRAACRQAKVWIKQQPISSAFTINVNISGKEFLAPDLTDRVAGALYESNLEPHRLKLEITETVAMDYAEMTVNTMKDLRDLGIQIALDDFGMGYSSLRYLPRFPIQTLKIDRSFVSTMGEKMESETIVRTIITMSHAMGLDVVAEGIESETHQTYLKAMQCDYGQGYLFSPAVSAERASLLLVGNGRIRRPSAL